MTTKQGECNADAMRVAASARSRVRMAAHRYNGHTTPAWGPGHMPALFRSCARYFGSVETSGGGARIGVPRTGYLRPGMSSAGRPGRTIATPSRSSAARVWSHSVAGAPSSIRTRAPSVRLQYATASTRDMGSPSTKIPRGEMRRMQRRACAAARGAGDPAWLAQAASRQARQASTRTHLMLRCLHARAAHDRQDERCVVLPCVCWSWSRVCR